MKYSIPYGKESVDVEIDVDVQIMEPNKFKLRDESELIGKALENPIGKEKFEEFARFDKSLLVVVNDGTRPTPTARIIDALAPVLTNHPDLKFIIATGAHRAPTEEEYDLIFGKYYEVFKKELSAQTGAKFRMIDKKRCK